MLHIKRKGVALQIRVDEIDCSFTEITSLYLILN